MFIPEDIKQLKAHILGYVQNNLIYFPSVIFILTFSDLFEFQAKVVGAIRTRTVGGNLRASQSFKTLELNEIDTNTVYLVQSIIDNVNVFELPLGFQLFQSAYHFGSETNSLITCQPQLTFANKRVALFPSPQRVPGGSKSPSCSTPTGLGNVPSATVKKRFARSDESQADRKKSCLIFPEWMSR